MRPKVTTLARGHRLLSLVAPYVHSRSEGSIHDAAERSRSLGLGYVAPRALAELLAITRAAWQMAPHVHTPTLMLQSTSDNRIPAADASRAFARLGSSLKELHWLTGCGHVLAVDFQRGEVFARTEDWLRRHGPV
jgi:alpha-beta hydrolase superfamily lysophospholipase